MARNYRKQTNKLNTQKREASASERSQRQKDKILRVSGRLFRQKGFLGTSVDDIAKAGNFNKASIYYYFKNKTQVLYDIAITTMGELFKQTTPVINSDLPAEKKLELLISVHLQVELSNISIAGIGQQERKNLTPGLLKSFIAIRDEYESIFYKTIDEILTKQKSKTIDARMATLYTLGLLNSIAQWYRPNGKLTQDEIIDYAIKYIFRAISLPR